MNRYSIEERILIIKLYHQRGENIADIQRGWSSAFKNKPKPLPSTIKALIEKFNRTGSVQDDIEGLKTAQRTCRTPDNIDKVRESIESAPSTSTRSVARDVGLSHTTSWRILRKDLGIFPYKIQIGQRLEARDIIRRKEFAEDICQLIDEKQIDIHKIIFSDEAHFYLDGYVNRQNYRIWGNEKPELTVTKPLHPQKITVWLGFCSAGIIGPIFIEGSIDSEVYGSILEQAFEEADKRGLIQGYHFQQDGAPPHCTNDNLQFIRNKFSDRVISRRYPEKFGDGMEWPPYSPDLSPLDYFVWGYTKDKVYRDRPQNLSELKKKIRDVLITMPPDFLQSTFSNFEKRVRLVIHRDGGHIEDIIH